MRSLKKIGFLAASALMLFAVGATMTACGEPGKVKASTLVYDGSRISWGAVKGAEKYVVTINDKSVTTTNTTYPFSQGMSMDSVTVSIYAVNAKEKEGKEITRTFTRLEQISASEITFDDMGQMSWAEVVGADSYVLSIQAAGAQAQEINVADTTYNQFEKDKSLKIKIKPTTTDGLSYSKFTEIENRKMYLSEPTDFRYDGADLRWSGNANALGYEIYINGGKDGDAPRNATSYTFDAEDMSFDVSLIAKGGYNNGVDIYDSFMSEEKRFHFLPVIEDAAIVNGALTWTAIPEAEGYSVEINGEPHVATTNSYALPAGTSLSVRVKAVTSGEVYFSSYSVSKPAFILEAPELEWFESATLEDGNPANAIHWDAVRGAVTGYKVEIENPDGTKGGGDYNADTRNVEHAFTATGGTYKVRVQATSTDADTYPSVYSADMIVERLPAPVLRKNNPIESDPTDNSKFNVTWNRVTNASGYKIYKNAIAVTGVQIADYTATINSPIPSEATGNTEQTYMIQSRGNGVEALANGVQRVRLSSVIPAAGNSADTCSFTITSKAMPTGLDCDGQYLVWNGSANQYAIRGLGGNRPMSVTVAQYDCYNLTPGAFMPSVCAEGDGAAVLASNYTASINVTRLAAPVNMRVSNYMADLPCVSWDEVPHAVGYKMTVNSGQAVMDVNIGDAISADYITEKGVTIALTAVGNVEQDNVHYITSPEGAGKTFIKLDTPTFSNQRVQNGELVWNAPGNAQETSSTFTYTLYNGKGQEVEVSLTSTKIKLTELDTAPGVYQYYVKCIGDPSCINSNNSETIEFEILQTPTLTRARTMYTWEPVPNAKSYEITVDGVLAKTVDHIDKPEKEDYYSYVPDKFVMPKTQYLVQIRAIGDDGYTTVNSATHNVYQETLRLDSPSFSVAYRGEENAPNVYSVNGHIVVNALPVNNAKAYEYTVGGATSDELSELSYEALSVSTGTYKITVRAIGGTFDQAGNYYISSNSAAEQTIILHAPVQNLSMSTSGKISWQFTTSYNSTTTAPFNGVKVIVYGENDVVLEEAIVKDSGKSYQLQTAKANDVKRIEVISLGGTNTEKADIEVQSQVAIKRF